MTKGYLQRILSNTNKYYRVTSKKKKTGKLRRIESPGKVLKGIQRWLLNVRISQDKVPSNIFGFIPHRNIKDNALMHINNRFLLNMDIEDFFPSIGSKKIQKAFQKLGYSKEKSEIYTKLCTYNEHLPQGAPTSPSISNLIFIDIDINILKITTAAAITYSRYADDLSFSSNNFEDLKLLEKKIIKLLNKNNFSINRNKTKYLTRKNKFTVTGLILNSGKPTIGRDKKRLLRSMIHHYISKKNVSLESKILGHLSFIKDIEPDYFKKYIKYIEKINKKYSKK